jgi:Ca-activated chloride channel family protein
MKLLKSVTKGQGLLLKILRFLVMLFIVIALASPVIKDEVIIEDNQGYEISLILDASGSMKQSNKFTITKQIVSDFIKERKTDRLALSIFADFAYVAVPLTYDKNSLLQLMEHIEVGIAGQSKTALYEALYLSSDLFKNSKSKNKIAILITDGFNNVDTIPLDVAISKANKYNIKVYTIAIGSNVDYDGMVLEKIANNTGGEFFEANSVEKLKQIYKTIDELEKSQIKTNQYQKIDYYYQYPLDAAIGLLFLLILINRRYG